MSDRMEEQLDAPREKSCPKCGATGTEGKGKDHLFYKSSPYCKTCHNALTKEHRKAPHRRKQMNEYNKQWQQKNPDKRRKWVRDYRERQKSGEKPSRDLTYARRPGRPRSRVGSSEQLRRGQGKDE